MDAQWGRETARDWADRAAKESTEIRGEPGRRFALPAA
jgi:hypothetical protein